MRNIPFAALVSVFLALPAFAETVTTVENDRVVVSQQGGQTTTVVQNGASGAPVAAIVPAGGAAFETVRDPRRIEGEIVSVDTPESQILVRDVDGREKRIVLKQGMINNYKVGDYVEIYLMADEREAKTIKTRRTADIEGEIARVDYANNLIVIRTTDGPERTVLVRPGLIQEHKTGDRIKMYVAVDDASPQTVRLIRVR
jgi:hypothetical protein